MNTRYKVKKTNGWRDMVASTQVSVVDSDSDNEDVLVEVDPDKILTIPRRRELATMLAQVMNVHGFEPEYGEEEEEDSE